MKHSMRLLSILLCLAIVLSMLPLAAFAFSTETTTIYFDNSVKKWSKVNAYYWNGSGNNSWPGSAMTKVEGDIWSIEVPNDAVNIIFNNGSGAQTGDLTVPTDGKNVHNGTSWGTLGSGDFEEVQMATVYVDLAATGWANVNAYFWGGTSATSWPGEAMKLVEGNIYSITISADTPNIIFNNGSAKTADLAFPGDGKIWNGAEFVDYATYVPGGEVTVKYYVLGSMNSWTAGDAYLMADNGDGTYSLELALAAGTHELKVNSNAGSWYPDGPDNVIVNVAVDGTVTVTFDVAVGSVAVTGDCLGGETTDPTDPSDPSVPVEPEDAEFYLFGYINGANYGCEEDAENLGEYKFVDGTLVATFEQDSYIGVKSNYGNWYMTEGWQGTEVNGAALYNTASGIASPDKLFVPGGVELIFTLIPDLDGSLSLSYVKNETVVVPVYNLVAGVTQNITIPVGGSVQVVVDATASDMNLLVTGNRQYYDWYIDNGRLQFYPNVMGAYELALVEGDTYTLTIGNSGEAEQVLAVTASAPVFGTMDRPAALVMGANTADVPTFDAYYFTWTAAEDGQLTIAIDTAVSSDWTYCINVYGNSYVYGDTHYSDDAEIVASETVSVMAGDVVEIVVGTASFEAAEVVLNASFTAGSQGGEEPDDPDIPGGDTEGVLIEEGTVALKSDSENESHIVEWTATADGTLYISTFATSDPGWAFMVWDHTVLMTGNEDSVYEMAVVEGTKYTIEFYAYSKVLWGTADGSVSYAINFKTGSGDVVVEKEEWVISDTLLAVGENDLAMAPNAENTLFEFEPTETGVYTFTAPAGILIGNWGTSFNPYDADGDGKTNVVTWTCSAVGQSLLIGVAGEESIILTIEKTGEAGGQGATEYIPYENTHTPFTFGETLSNVTYVDITVAQTAVPGTDGFYHLGTADGPVLYYDMITDAVDLYNAFFGGYGATTVRAPYTDGDGNTTNYDFYESVKAYVDATNDDGLYPLTEDLVIFLKAFGKAQGWFMTGLSPFEAINVEHNADSAWLVACCYVEAPKTELAITKQPVNASAYANKTAKVTVEAQGDGLTYAWYFANKGSTKFSLTTSFKGSSYSISMTDARDGRQVYCVITDAYGNSVTTDTVTLSLRTWMSITKQPVNASAYANKTAKVTFSVKGDGLTYKWYYKNPGASKFSYTSSFKTNTYSLSMTEARDGRQVYCVITDAYGRSVKTDVVTLSLRTWMAITKQPVNVSAYNGKTAKVTFSVKGDGLTYKWYYANKGSDKFTYTSSFKGATYSLSMTEARSGRRVYCVITDAYGRSVKTDVVTLTQRTWMSITKQPVNVTVAKGSVAKVTVGVKGDGLTYKWYYAEAGSDTFKLTTSFKTATYKIEMSAARAGRRVYCVITDAYGRTVTTDVVTLGMK